MAKVYLGLGSNLGNRQHFIEEAIKLLNEHEATVCAQASVIETEPVGGPPQGKFLNTVILIETPLSPEMLLERCLLIEAFLGRHRVEPNGPRTIDIDILLYDRQIINTPRLTIPHPRMFEREFVLTPLREIAPDILEELFHAHH